MAGCSRKLFYIAALLLGWAGVLLCLAGPQSPAGAQDSRVLQVWPDRSIGVTTGLLEGSTVHATTQVFPFGVCRISAGDVVHARTYLHFPLDVFPPGAEILHATLYVYVEGASDVGEATFGAYRIVESWEEEGWSGDPVTWPALLYSPIATAMAHFDVVTPTLPVSTPVPAATSIPTPTPDLTPTVTPTSTVTPTPTVTPTVALTPTPPTSPLPTPTASPPPTPTFSPPPPTPTSSPPLAVPVVPLGQVAGTWLTWDVTALMRAWLAGEVPDDGLALAPAPDPDADPETAGDLLVARWFTAADSNTRPYLIVEFDVHPVTPTPTSTPVPVLPPAGSPVGSGTVGLLLVGAALLMLGLAVRHR